MFQTKGAFHDQHEDAWHGGQVGEDHKQGHAQIDRSHHRHHPLGNLRHFADTTENDRCGNQYQADGHQVFVPAPCAFGCGHDGVSLYRIEHQAKGNNQRDGESNTQPALAQAFLDVVSRAATEGTVVVVYLEQLGQGGFGKGAGHTQQRGHPHPEHGTRAAQCNGGGHAGDVAGTHTASQAGSKSLEGGDIAAFAIVAAATQHFLPAARQQANLHKAHAHGKEQAYANQDIDK